MKIPYSPFSLLAALLVCSVLSLNAGYAADPTATADGAVAAGAAKSDDPDFWDAAAIKAAADAKAAEAAAANAKVGDATLPGVMMTPAKVTDLMKTSASCVKHHWQQNGPVCCDFSCPHKAANCCKWAYEYPIDYWEPSELIEVSCRNGYSMMKPGLKGRGDARLQSCQGANKPGGGHYFFEARVWAIDGDDGGVRHQAMGANVGAQTKQCSEEKLSEIRYDIKNTITPSGYGIKWQKFSHSAPRNGPSGSWSAYISDNDDSWAKDDGAGGSVPNQKACSIGGVDLPNCWGPVTATGWVDHPNPRVAAALVAWRAHTKARSLNTVSPADGKGYQMAMEFPFLKYGGPFAGTMGAPNGGKTGSACFQPGDSGPEWFGGMKPDAIPAFVKTLKQGEVASVTEMNSGIYIFTIWVHTSCIRYAPIPTGGPTGTCYYKGLS